MPSSSDDTGCGGSGSFSSANGSFLFLESESAVTDFAYGSDDDVFLGDGDRLSDRLEVEDLLPGSAILLTVLA